MSQSTSEPRKPDHEIIQCSPECLHCAINRAIGMWALAYAPRQDGLPLVDPTFIVGQLFDCANTFLKAVPETMRPQVGPIVRSALERVLAGEPSTAAFPASSRVH